MANKTFKILIVGGGSGGISLAARLVRAGFKGQIGLLEPTEYHYYQPIWTLVGAGGIVSKASSQRSESSVIPFGVEWVRDRVKEFRPDANQVQTADSGVIEYHVMIVATGLELDFDKIDGLEGNLGKNGLLSLATTVSFFPHFLWVRQRKGESIGSSKRICCHPCIGTEC